MDAESHKPDPKSTRARGARSNAPGRFEGQDRVRTDDGWDPPEPRLLRTEVQIDQSRSILARNTSPDIPFDRSINPYRGCEHGCIYCFARPTHAFLGLSPGLDFETRLFAKPDAAKLLRRTLSRKGYVPKPIAIGTNTDPYQPIEKDHRIMERILQVLSEFRHPVTIVTKGALIRRDAGILGEMGRAGLAQVGVSLTTLDADLSRRMEPRAAAPKQRLLTIETLAKAGVPVRAMVAPVIPGLTDHEMEALMTAAADAGASACNYIVLRLPLEVSPLFREWLDEVEPGRAKGVMQRIRAMRGGKDYDAEWGRRMTGEGVTAELLARRFEVALKRTGLVRQMAELRTDQFRVPGSGAQLSLF